MLTSDENMVQVEINVQYVVSDPEAFLFNVTTPMNSLGQATQTVPSVVSLVVQKWKRS